MNTSDVVERLVHLGLNSYEARAYAALTTRESSTAAEVARIAGVPRQRIYDVLAGLVEKGLTSIRPGPPLRYTPAPPGQAIEGLVEAQRRRLTQLEEEATEAVQALSPVYREGLQTTDPLDYIEVLRDPNAINARFDELQATVQREILVFNRPPYARPPQENIAGLEIVRSHEARSLYEYSLFDDLAATEGVRRFVHEGEQARVVPQLPLKLAIIDESVVMFGMEDPVAGGSDLTIMVVQHPALAQVLKLAFDAFWERGETFQQAYDKLVGGGARSA